MSEGVPPLSRRSFIATGVSTLASAAVASRTSGHALPSPSDLHYLSLVEAAGLIRRRELSPVELTVAQLERIDRLEPALQAYIEVLAERALNEAKKATAEIQAGNYKGPLHGIPVAVKDLYFTRGIPTRGGSGALANHVPTYDATVVQRFSAAGAVLLGKLNTTEGAMVGYHRDFEVPRNPWGLDRFPGWSSSGSGVATAAGLCYASLGTDTGGSIRTPSAANGIVGLKPTWGRISRYGVLGLAPSLDHVGPMTRSVADAAAVLRALAGRDDNDPTSLPDSVPEYVGEIQRGIRDIRVGYDEDYIAEQVEPATAAAVEKAARDLESLGAHIIEVKMPAFQGRHGAAWNTICSSEAAAEHAATFPSQADRYGTFFRSFLENGAAVTGAGYARAHAVRLEMSGDIRKLFQEIDLLVCPSFAHSACSYDPADAYGGVDREAETLAGVPFSCLGVSSRFTMPFNFCGYPTLSLPCGFSTEGMPLSVQLVGRPLSESLLLRAGQAFEEATQWHTHHPPEIARDPGAGPGKD